MSDHVTGIHVRTIARKTGHPIVSARRRAHHAARRPGSSLTVAACAHILRALGMHVTSRLPLRLRLLRAWTLQICTIRARVALLSLDRRVPDTPRWIPVPNVDDAPNPLDQLEVL